MYRLPTSLRSELKTPMGPVRSGPEAVEAAEGHAPLVTVGDVVTRTFVDAGRTPDVMIIDHRTERAPAEDDPLAGLDGPAPVHLQVANPAAAITEELWEAVVAALERGGPTVVDVDGEEDLAALPAMNLAPDGAMVVYGQPGEGVVTVPVTPETRQRVQDLLARMET